MTASAGQPVKYTVQKKDKSVITNMESYDTTIATTLKTDGSADITIARREDGWIIAQFELSPESWVGRPLRGKIADNGSLTQFETIPELPRKNRLGY